MRFVAVLAFLYASQAHALSCIPADPAGSFQRFAESEKSYVVLYGTFDFNERKLPKRPEGNPNNTKPNTFIPTTFVGKSLSQAGFVNDFSRDVTLNATCLGPWCSRMKSDVPTVAFVQKEGQKYTLTIGPCGGAAFTKPDQRLLDALTACIRGETCERSDGMFI